MPPISSSSEELDSNGPIIADFNTRDTDLGYFDLSFPDRPELPWAVCRHQEHAGGQRRATRSVRASAKSPPRTLFQSSGTAMAAEPKVMIRIRRSEYLP
jgi:hypothetical protein